MTIEETMDRFSELPQPLLHHIMSFLPQKDLIRAGSSSKTLMSALYSFPVSIEFNYGVVEDLIDIEILNSEVDEFLNYVVSNIPILNPEAKLEKFRLQVPITSGSPDRRINKMISFAVRNGVKELDIAFGFSCDKDGPCYLQSSCFYPLPIQAIACCLPSSLGNSITILRLRGTNLQCLRQVILGCPKLVTLIINNCNGKNNVCGILHDRAPIEIESPILQKFKYKGASHLATEIVINVSGCKNLKFLSLENADITDKWVEHHVRTLFYLETLRIKICSKFENLKVLDHDKLRRIKLVGCDRLQSVEIEAANLEFLTYICKEKSECKINIDGCRHLKHLKLQ